MSIRAVHHLSCLTMCPPGAFLLGQRGLGRGRLVAHCLLVETARDGLVLVDTGLGTRDVEGKTVLSPGFRLLTAPRLAHEDTAVAQVERLGYAPSDVRHVVVTHLDVDHAGGIADFPDARVHLHAREHAAALVPASRLERERYVQAHWAHGPKWQVYAEDGDTWRGLPAVTRLAGVDADLAIVPLHGHTRGHTAVVVRAGERWLVHAGDAYFHRSALEGRSVPLGLAAFERAMRMDKAAWRASLAALRQLHASYTDLDIFSAHDPAEYDALTSRRA